MPDYLNSTEATALLGVSRATLYAYVSRGLLHAHAADTPRESRYLREEVEQLARQRGQGRKPREVAQAALNWGLPVLESSITLIEQGRLYYRGEDAVDRSEEHTSELQSPCNLVCRLLLENKKEHAVRQVEHEPFALMHRQSTALTGDEAMVNPHHPRPTFEERRLACAIRADDAQDLVLEY